MLSNVTIGDWVFTIQSGWQKVKDVRILKEEVWIGCNGCLSVYTRSGKYQEDDIYPSAWPEGHPDIPHWAPPRPKRKVKKKVEKYARIHIDAETGKEVIGITLYDSPEEVINHPGIPTYIKFVGEYEVEE